MRRWRLLKDYGSKVWRNGTNRGQTQGQTGREMGFRELGDTLPSSRRGKALQRDEEEAHSNVGMYIHFCSPKRTATIQDKKAKKPSIVYCMTRFEEVAVGKHFISFHTSSCKRARPIHNFSFSHAFGWWFGFNPFPQERRPRSRPARPWAAP